MRSRYFSIPILILGSAYWVYHVLVRLPKDIQEIIESRKNYNTALGKEYSSEQKKTVLIKHARDEYLSIILCNITMWVITLGAVILFIYLILHNIIPGIQAWRSFL